MEPRDLVVGCPRELLERRDDRLVLLQDQQPLRRVAPPAVGMRQMRDELRGCFAIHPRCGEIRFDWRNRRLADVRRRCGHRRPAVVPETPDPTMRRHLVQLVLLDLRAQVRARPGPLQFLDDAVVHVGDVERAVGCVADVHRTEQLVVARHELRTRIHVAQHA